MILKFLWCLSITIISLRSCISFALPSLTLQATRSPFRSYCPEVLNVYLNTDGESVNSVDLKLFIRTGELLYSLATIRSQNTSLFPNTTVAPIYANTVSGDITLQLAVARPAWIWSTVGWLIGSYLLTNRTNITGSLIDRYLASNGTKVGIFDFTVSGWRIYEFVNQPCQDDLTAPNIQSYVWPYPSNTTPLLNSLQNIWNQSWIRFAMSEAPWLSVAYAYSGWVYTGTGPWFLRDHQRWVNPLLTNISITKRLGWAGWSIIRNRLFTGGEFSDTNAALYTTGDGITRDEYDRNQVFAISGSQLTWRGIENTIQVYIESRDRSPYSFATPHTGNKQISNIQFNNPSPPVVSSRFPLPWASNIPSSTSISANIHDTRAGVNTGSVKIRLLASGYIHSGVRRSGSDLVFTLISGNLGAGNAGSYAVTLPNSIIGLLPTPAVPVIVQISGFDLADVPNPIGVDGTRSFVTRASCSTYQCGEPINIKLWSAPWIVYTGWTQLIITGWNNPTYTEIWHSQGTGIIQCNLITLPYSWLNIQWTLSGWAPISLFDTGSQRFFSGDDQTILSLSGNILSIRKQFIRSINYNPPAISGFTSGDVVATLIITGGILTWENADLRTFINTGLYVFTATRNTGRYFHVQDTYGETLQTGSVFVRWIDKSIKLPYIVEVRPEKRVNSGTNRSTYGEVEVSQSGVVIFSTGVTINNLWTWLFIFPFLDTGWYDVGFKGQSHLRSINRTELITTETRLFDLTYTGTRFLFFGDFLRDNLVDSFDLWVLLWRYWSTSDVITDADLDGVIDSFDLGIFLGNYGMTGEDHAY